MIAPFAVGCCFRVVASRIKSCSFWTPANVGWSGQSHRSKASGSSSPASGPSSPASSRSSPRSQGSPRAARNARDWSPQGARVNTKPLREVVVVHGRAVAAHDMVAKQLQEGGKALWMIMMIPKHFKTKPSRNVSGKSRTAGAPSARGRRKKGTSGTVEEDGEVWGYAG